MIAKLSRALALLLAACLLASASLLGGCAVFRSTTAPIPTLVFPAAVADASDAAVGPLVVLLPGLFDEPKDFARHGFVETIRDARPDAEIVAVDAHIGYYRERSVLDRLEADVLAPATREGDREIWLVGTSLGGCGSLLAAERWRGRITGVVALAPYLGPDDLLETIEATGDPGKFEPADDEDRGFQRLWLWLVERAERADAKDAPTLYLGYGRDDRSAEDHALFAERLPEDRVVVLDGGHDWPVWRRALEASIANGALSPAETGGDS